MNFFEAFEERQLLICFYRRELTLFSDEELRAELVRYPGLAAPLHVSRAEFKNGCLVNTDHFVLGREPYSFAVFCDDVLVCTGLAPSMASSANIEVRFYEH